MHSQFRHTYHALHVNKKKKKKKKKKLKIFQHLPSQPQKQMVKNISSVIYVIYLHCLLLSLNIFKYFVGSYTTTFIANSREFNTMILWSKYGILYL